MRHGRIDVLATLPFDRQISMIDDRPINSIE
jgi:hypothetical protein